MKKINNHELQLNEQLTGLIDNLAEIQNKIIEEKFSFELKRKNFFEISSSEKFEGKQQNTSTLPSLPQNKTKLDDEFINNTIRKILKI